MERASPDSQGEHGGINVYCTIKFHNESVTNPGFRIITVFTVIYQDPNKNGLTE